MDMRERWDEEKLQLVLERSRDGETWRFHQLLADPRQGEYAPGYAPGEPDACIWEEHYDTTKLPPKQVEIAGLIYNACQCPAPLSQVDRQEIIAIEAGEASLIGFCYCCGKCQGVRPLTGGSYGYWDLYELPIVMVGRAEQKYQKIERAG